MNIQYIKKYVLRTLRSLYTPISNIKNFNFGFNSKLIGLGPRRFIICNVNLFNTDSFKVLFYYENSFYEFIHCRPHFSIWWVLLQEIYLFDIVKLESFLLELWECD